MVSSKILSPKMTLEVGILHGSYCILPEAEGKEYSLYFCSPTLMIIR